MGMTSVSNRRHVVERLHHSEERFRLLVESVQDYALFMLDPAGRVVSWNQGAERIKGYRTEEIIGRHFSLFYRPEDLESRKPELALEAAARTGRLEDEGWRVRKDGTRFWARAVITAMRDESGKLRGFGKVIRDLTERIQATHSLKTSEARLQAFMKFSPSIMFIKSLDGRYQYVNDPFCRSFGLDRDAVLGHTDAELFSNDQAARFQANDAGVIATGDAMEFEETAEYQDGSHIGIVCKFPIRDAEGLVSALGGVVTDITSRKRVERELLDKRACLEAAQCPARVWDSPDSVNMRASDRVSGPAELEAFTQMVARDLRVPLRHIENLAAHVQESLAGMNDTARRLHAIAQSAAMLGKVTSDLMLFSQADRRLRRHRRVELDPIVVGARNELGPAATAGRVNWRLGALPAVVGDCALLRVVFANLLSNALKFTRLRERALIEVIALPGAEGDFEVVIAVGDNGIGFNQRFAQAIFDPFRRVHGPREFDGAGIGLATAKRIVERHGGRIWAESEPGSGARFFIALKRAV